MADRGWLVPIALLCALSGCADEDADPLLLRRVCGGSGLFGPGSACPATGDVTVGTGITGDTPAFRFGPAGGRIDILLVSLPEAQEAVWSLEALVKSDEGTVLSRLAIDWTGPDGECSNGLCPPEVPAASVTIPAGEAGWARIVDNELGTSFALPAFGATLTLEAANLELYDLRVP